MDVQNEVDVIRQTLKNIWTERKKNWMIEQLWITFKSKDQI